MKVSDFTTSLVLIDENLKYVVTSVNSSVQSIELGTTLASTTVSSSSTPIADLAAQFAFASYNKQKEDTLRINREIASVR